MVLHETLGLWMFGCCHLSQLTIQRASTWHVPHAGVIDFIKKKTRGTCKNNKNISSFPFALEATSALWSIVLLNSLLFVSVIIVINDHQHVLYHLLLYIYIHIYVCIYICIYIYMYIYLFYHTILSTVTMRKRQTCHFQPSASTPSFESRCEPSASQPGRPLPKRCRGKRCLGPNKTAAL